MRLIKIRLFVLCFIFLLLSLPLAFATEGENEEITLDKLLNSKNEVNSYLQENEILIPNGVDVLIKDGNIFVNISMNDGSLERFYIIVEEKKVLSVEEGIPEKMNYEIKTDEETILAIMQSGDISGKIVEAYDDEKITIKAYGFGNKLKLFFGKIFFKMFT